MLKNLYWAYILGSFLAAIIWSIQEVRSEQIYLF